MILRWIGLIALSIGLTVIGSLSTAVEVVSAGCNYDASVVPCSDRGDDGASIPSFSQNSTALERRTPSWNAGTTSSPTFVAPNTAAGAGRPVFPPNRGFEFDSIETTLKPGASIDRYGSRHGTFASPEGTPFGQRSLPEASRSKSYEAYEVLKPIPGVNMGPARPWFGQPGLGVQYELPKSVEQLIEDGFLGVKK